MIRFTKKWRTCYSRLQWLSIHTSMGLKARTHFKLALYPLLIQQKGFLDAQFFSERDGHPALIVTVWASEAHCQRADQNSELQVALLQLSERFACQSQVSYCELIGQI